MLKKNLKNGLIDLICFTGFGLESPKLTSSQKIQWIIILSRGGSSGSYRGSNHDLPGCKLHAIITGIGFETKDRKKR